MAEPWIAPEVADRRRPPYSADEKDMLDGWLEYHRATLLFKCAGLTGEQLCERAVPPSSLSLLGLVRHMSEVERWWFRRALGEDVPTLYCPPESEDGDFDDTDPANAEADFATYERECALARENTASLPLDTTYDHPRRGPVQLRWIYTHMVEEYARHNGHADLLRERLDGATGA
jgi:uncharacterized damage-inducible protein DinB